ncbi:hypothetical protein CHS0354_013147 [Potamilus streckersoni]|uniref:IspG C-terminal domain-containing protein n=1 Tax=Potamilus streckersoni TaxID=2493646 RepID=A0AAE0S6N0_9BIVA|nr:hypothetical protein CHS0354_013147 [Potamilus streckersoni]
MKKWAYQKCIRDCGSADGRIGDTIRVSLTEPSVNEIEFAKKLTSFTERYISGLPCLPKQSNPEKNDLPFLSGDVSISRRKNKAVSVSGIITEPVGYIFPEDIRSDSFESEIFLANAVGEGLLDFVLIPENLPVAGIRRIKQILQVTRVKLTETDYIACPSCGRTLFDLTEVTAEIKKHTSHLIGLKIGIMGCIVNGPGEMADADFGYVGAGTDKIDLYVQKDRVKKNIPQSEAVNELIALIKSAGRWKEPPSV